MKRRFLTWAFAASLFWAPLSVGCTGNQEIKPDQVQTPTVDPAEVQKERDRAMEKMRQQKRP
jgi:hypothetical protein